MSRSSASWSSINYLHGDMTAELIREAAAMDELAAVSPIPNPLHLAHGEPGRGYPLPWSVRSNPTMSALGRSTLSRILTDQEIGSASP